MISWHRVRQKVACVGSGWRWATSKSPTTGPEEGEICTIMVVYFDGTLVSFVLEEYGGMECFASNRFRPIYPQIIDQLRKLDVPLIERVKEDA